VIGSVRFCGNENLLMNQEFKLVAANFYSFTIMNREETLKPVVASTSGKVMQVPETSNAADEKLSGFATWVVDLNITELGPPNNDLWFRQTIDFGVVFGVGDANFAGGLLAG
jgi:hypothetical protein